MDGIPGVVGRRMYVLRAGLDSVWGIFAAFVPCPFPPSLLFFFFFFELGMCVLVACLRASLISGGTMWVSPHPLQVCVAGFGFGSRSRFGSHIPLAQLRHLVPCSEAGKSYTSFCFTLRMTPSTPAYESLCG